MGVSDTLNVRRNQFGILAKTGKTNNLNKIIQEIVIPLKSFKQMIQQTNFTHLQ